jgi:hypothetical protein
MRPEDEESEATCGIYDLADVMYVMKNGIKIGGKVQGSEPIPYSHRAEARVKSSGACPR